LLGYKFELTLMQRCRRLTMCKK